MATVTVQLTSLTQEIVTENIFPLNGSNAPPANPSQAPGAPTQQDTVTLTPQSAQAQGQQTQQNRQQPEFQLDRAQAFALESATNLGLANDAGDSPTAGAAVTTAAGTSIPAPTQAAAVQFPPADAAPGQVAVVPVQADPVPETIAAAGAAETGSAGTPTPQQQLNQLDQTLQQLGVDPNSISLFNRLALLLYASDPSALAAFVQQLQGTTQQNAAETNSATAQGQMPSQGTQPRGQEAVPQASQAPSQANLPSQPPSPAPNPSASAQVLVLQFQELQLAFATGFGQGSGQGSSTATNTGNSINVTI